MARIEERTRDPRFTPLLPQSVSPLLEGVGRPLRKRYWWQLFRPETRLLQRQAYERSKRGVDLLLLVASLPVTLPLFLLIALLIKLESPGAPVIFTQMRTGQHGVRFRMFKFRTMVPNAEELKKELLHLNELTWPDFKITDDPRVTRMGRFLRRTSLDELPQLINIAKGEMSFVGPRPTSFRPETYKLWHTERLDVIPGLTGLWQISGRASLDFDDRVRLDIAYIRHRSLMLDFFILLCTVTAVLRQDGAY
jgi:lipopolysaccharide/colanic/teichoic acid biosynthesis glycosyltransferase